MRIKYPAVIVVEGASDVALLSGFLDADIVTTNGSEISRETIEYLKELRRTRDIVVLTDPDQPGKRIRDILNEHISGLKHAYIPKNKAIKRHKVGVAESDKETILEALDFTIPSAGFNETITMADLQDLGLIGGQNSGDLRKFLSLRFHFGHTNGKTFYKRVNALGIEKEKLEEALKEYDKQR